MGPPGRRGRKLALVFVIVVSTGEAARFGASFFRPPVEVDIGPSTADYVEGFTESEERVPVSFRWTTERAELALPLEAVPGPGPATLQLRYARFLDGTATVRVFTGGRPAASFRARSGRFRTEPLQVDVPSGDEPLRIELLVDDPDPTRLGIALDWVRIEGPRFRLPANGNWARGVLVGVLAVAWLAGLSPAGTLATGLAVALAQAAWLAASPFAMAHAHASIGASGLVASLPVALLVRGRPGAERLLPLLFLLGFWLKGAALFHPSYYYADVRLHRRHLEAFAAAEGGIVERGIQAQRAAFTAYPRIVAGRKYAFPYSPVFYLPFALADGDGQGGREMEALMKHVGLLSAALEVPLVFVLGRILLGGSVAAWAAMLTVFLPPSTSRLLYAQWPTLAGHVLDLVAILAAAKMMLVPGSTRHLLGYGAAGLASCLMYVTSAVNLSLFTAAIALFYRRRVALLLMWSLVGIATVLLLYLPFAKLLVTEILPALGRGGATANPSAGLGGAVNHVLLFYGVGYPALSLAGLLRVRQRGDAIAFRVLAAFGLSVLGLVLLRAASGVFKDLKELLYVGPFFAITTAVALETLASSRRSGRLAAAAISVGLVGLGLAKSMEYFELHTRLAGLP